MVDIAKQEEILGDLSFHSNGKLREHQVFLEFKGFSGKSQNLCRIVVAELSPVTCIVPSVSVIHRPYLAAMLASALVKKLICHYIQYQLTLAFKISRSS